MTLKLKKVSKYVNSLIKSKKGYDFPEWNLTKENSFWFSLLCGAMWRRRKPCRKSAARSTAPRCLPTRCCPWPKWPNWRSKPPQGQWTGRRFFGKWRWMCHP